MKNYIFIDGSYFVYHRYFSLVRWWKCCHEEEKNGIEIFSQNKVFVDKFKKTFLELIHSLPKKLNKLGATILVGKDCKKKNIWRKQFYNEYKETRTHNEDISFFMTISYNELFIQPHISMILHHPSLEADDCIAIYIQDILQDAFQSISIITSDKDYLQLVAPTIYVFDMKLNDLSKQKSSFGCSKKDLFCKIVMGDISDNIPPIFKKCGMKTSAKYFDDQTSFYERLHRENAMEQWKLNQLLVDFHSIPTNIRKEFIEYIK
jgi:5'-3' exonuclease